MQKSLTLTCLSLFFLLFSAKAQFINADSLIVIEGLNIGCLISELDSMEFYSPELMSDKLAQESITSGYLLSMFSMPGSGHVISRFGPRSGRMHTGTDIKMSKGDTIYAAFDGIVTRRQYYHGYGNMIVVDHGNNIETYYAHLSGYIVQDGASVEMGEPIGLAGSSGRATTSHLHFEIREDGKPYDSELVFDFENGKTRAKIAEIENLAELQKELKPKGYSVSQPASQKYIVRSGDSLYKISKRTRTTIKSLCMLNALRETSVLQIGQILNVY